MRRNHSLKLESLEAKSIPSAGPVTPFGISMNSYGILNIKGGTQDDGGHVWVGDDGMVHASLSHTSYTYQGGAKIPITVFDPEKTYTPAQVKGIHFMGYDGEDSFTNDTAVKATAFGSAGNDVLIGGWGADILSGSEGDDVLEGRQGNDVLRGGIGDDDFVFSPVPITSRSSLGSDTITDEDANVGADTLDFSALGAGVKINLGSTAAQTVKSGYLKLTLTNGLAIENVCGTPGADTITGNSRPNNVFAYGGNDVVTGKGGADVVWGQGGNDILYGNGGNDVLDGGADNDKIYPGTDTNTVSDGSGDDYVDFHLNAFGLHYTTGGGNDKIIGTLFDDQITGSSGNDWLEGGVGDDILNGGSGNDMLLPGIGSNSINDGWGDDVVDFSDNAVAVNYTTDGGNDKVIGTEYDDQITGSSGSDKLFGGKGEDHLFGLAGTDEIHGGDGDDWMEPGSKNELAYGEGGYDYNANNWAINGATYEDVRQGGTGTCVFLSGLAGAAQQGMNLESRISYLGNYTYNVQLFNPDGGTYNQHVTFNGEIDYAPFSKKRMDPWSATEGEFWTILYQRAYLSMTDILDVNYKAPENAMRAATGRSVDTDDWDDPTVLKNALLAGKVVTAGDADDTNMVYASHSYTVMSVYQVNGTWYIKLRNPWGYDVGAGKTASGANGDGIIVLTWNSFQGKHDFDRISIS